MPGWQIRHSVKPPHRLDGQLEPTGAFWRQAAAPVIVRLVAQQVLVIDMLRDWRQGSSESTMNDSLRIHRRVPHRAQTPVMDSRNGRFLDGLSRDLSHSGIFVELRDSPPVGTVVDLFIGGVGVGVQVLGRIVRVEQGVGFGATFTSDAAAVHRLLRAPTNPPHHGGAA